MALDENQRLADDIARALAKVLRNTTSTFDGSRGGSASNNNNGSGRNTESSISSLDVKLTNKNFKQLAKTANHLISEIEDMDKGLSKSKYSMNELIGTQSHFVKSMLDHDTMTNKMQDKLMIKLKEQMGNYSFMGKSMKEYGDSMRDLGELFDDSGKLLSDYNSILEENGETTLKNMKKGKKLNKVLADMASSMSKDSILRKHINEALASGDEAKIEAAQKAVLEEVKNAKNIRRSVQETTTAYGKHQQFVKGSSELMDKFASNTGLSFIKQLATVTGAIALMGLGIKGLYTQFFKFAKVGFGTGGSFWQITKSMLSLGISQDVYAEALAKNAGTVAQVGLEDFARILDDSQLSMARLGLGTDDAAKATLGFVQTAREFGQVAGTKGLDKSIKAQIKSFTVLKAITGVTAEQFAEQNKNLTESTEFRTKMTRLNSQERINVLNGIMLERQRLAVMGLSNEQQLKFIKSTQGALSAKVSTRFEQSGKLVQALSAMGLGDQAMEARRIMLLGSRASAKETSKLGDIVRELGSRMDVAQGTRGLATESLIDSLRAGFGTEITGMLTAGTDARLAEAKKLTEQQVAARIATVKTSENMARVRTSIDKLGNVITSPLLSILAAIGGIALLMIRGNRSLLKGLGGGKSGFTGPKPQGRLGKLAGSVKGGISKVIGVASKATGGGISMAGVGKTLLKGARFLGPIALAANALSAIYGGFDAYSRAAEIFGKKTATTQEKVSAALGGAISTFTFGLISEKGTAKFINKGINVAKSAGKVIWSGLKKATSVIGDAIGMGFSLYGKIIKGAINMGSKVVSAAWEKIKSFGTSVLGVFGIGQDRPTSKFGTSTTTASRINTIANKSTAAINTATSNNITETSNTNANTNSKSSTNELLMELINKISELVEIANEDKNINLERVKNIKLDVLKSNGRFPGGAKMALDN